ncbi:hypothetical protein MIND_00165900 [Mycena indigotica]|uniref:Uncharacterized protein n=1 Tax=Mycena indigotica TaxID=2126181 RepID=A0A8H6TD93_9AGAR|nr:uncharacterized protein MIND_00165900 [Mycena indigotica]KAF7316468.1 hypothetical protein MIND_00165900 [Mycena indigotica]
MSKSLLRDVLKRNQEKGKAPETQTLVDSSEKSTTGSFNPSSSRRSMKSLLLPSSSAKSISGSIRSSGAASLRSIASLAQSMVSFYSMITGGDRVPKRRRPDFSKLGVPEWYAEDPPPAPLMPGTAEHSPVPPLYVRGMANVIHERFPGDKPYVGIVLYSHAPAHSNAALYHNEARVQGEVRLDIRKKDNIKSINVWLTIAAESVLDIFTPPMYAFTANLWNREMGDPRKIDSSKETHPWRGRFPKGTFVFPFEFPELPKDVVVKHPTDGKRRNLARVPLPPTYFISQVTGFSGGIKYIVGVNIERDGFNGIDDELDMQFQYLPLCKPLPRVPTAFPFIPTREDWPFSRETVGGWILTPFGGRGRLGEEMVEVEGILGVQDPPVYTANDTIQFSILLWSKNPLALEALGQPAAVEVAFLKSDMFALDVMTPRTSTRKNRYLGRLAAGRAWRTDDGRPEDDEPIPEFKLVTLPEPKPKTLPEGGSYRVKGASSSRMKEVYVADEEDLEGEAKIVEKQTGLADDSESTKGLENQDAELVQKQSEEPDLADDGESTKETVVADGESVTERAPSPTPSLDDIEEETEDHFLRMDGEVKVPACTHPNFRYTHMGREYVVHLIFTHPQYNHISPNATGILAEFPVWYVLDRFGHHPPIPEHRRNLVQTPEDLAKLPIGGTAIPVGPSTARAPKVIGKATDEKRPTGKYVRYFAF